MSCRLVQTILVVGCLLVMGIPSRRVQPRRDRRGQLTAELLGVERCSESAAYVLPNVTQYRGAAGDFRVEGIVRVIRPMKSVRKITTVYLWLNKIHPLYKLCTGRVSFIQCSDYGLDCTVFQVWRLGSSSCSYWDMKNTFWVNVSYSIFDLEPPYGRLRCPINVGTYQIRNASIDFEHLGRWPFVQDRVWRVDIEATDENEVPWLCVRITTKILRFSGLKRNNATLR